MTELRDVVELRKTALATARAEGYATPWTLPGYPLPAKPVGKEAERAWPLAVLCWEMQVEGASPPVPVSVKAPAYVVYLDGKSGGRLRSEQRADASPEPLRPARSSEMSQMKDPEARVLGRVFSAALGRALGAWFGRKPIPADTAGDVLRLFRVVVPPPLQSLHRELSPEFFEALDVAAARRT